MAQNGSGLGSLYSTVLRQSIRVVLFVVLVALLLGVLYIPITLGLALVTLLSPALGSSLAALSVFVTFFAFIYLYFVVPALVLDDLAVRSSMRQSVKLVRSNFIATFGFVLIDAI